MPRDDPQDMIRSLHGILIHLRRMGYREIWRTEKSLAYPRSMERTSAACSSPSIPPKSSPAPSRVPASGRPAESQPLEEKQNRLQIVRRELGDCTRCRLHATRTHLVFGEGNPGAPLVFVGEGPGADEDRLGRPFVGRAGKLLDKMIRALGMDRPDVYICNVVKCRPPGNRTPAPEEIEACSPFLIKQLEAIDPQVICTLGACATQTLLQTKSPISKLREGVRLWRGIPVIPTYHPAYLLRNPAKKADTWRDLLKILEILG